MKLIQQHMPFPSSPSFFLLRPCNPLLPPILPNCCCFALSVVLRLLFFFINALVISRNASSTPYPVFALVFNTFKLWVCSNCAISSSVTSISRSWSSSSPYSLWPGLLAYISHLLAITMTLTSFPQCFSISFSHPSTLINESRSVRSNTTKIPSAPL